MQVQQALQYLETSGPSMLTLATCGLMSRASRAQTSVSCNAVPKGADGQEKHEQTCGPSHMLHTFRLSRSDAQQHRPVVQGCLAALETDVHLENLSIPWQSVVKF